jgi:hypothetical protein
VRTALAEFGISIDDRAERQLTEALSSYNSEH